MKSGSLADNPEFQLPAEVTDKASDDAQHTNFTSLRLMGSKSNEVETGLVKPGVWAVIGSDEPQVLASSIVALVVHMRYRALDYSSKPVRCTTDLKDPMYAEIEANSSVKDSDCMAGPEYLLYLPETDSFEPYWLANKSSKFIHKKLLNAMRKAVTLKTVFKQLKFNFWAPEVYSCDEVFEIPSDDRILAAVTAFSHANVQKEAEAAEEQAEGTRAR